jgi:hypothetical protein
MKAVSRLEFPARANVIVGTFEKSRVCYEEQIPLISMKHLNASTECGCAGLMIVELFY